MLYFRHISQYILNLVPMHFQIHHIHNNMAIQNCMHSLHTTFNHIAYKYYNVI